MKTISTIWMPIVASFVFFILGVMDLKSASDKQFCNIGLFFIVVLCVVSIVFTWISYYTVIYFLR